MAGLPVELWLKDQGATFRLSLCRVVLIFVQGADLDRSDSGNEFFFLLFGLANEVLRKGDLDHSRQVTAVSSGSLLISSRVSFRFV